ncbi:MAG: ABC transporter permease [Armatimonadota bacterium]|nr:ABC transporter permease [Armatimonadota bacterium]MDR7439987.1 ABC transporter permease [Armatimonadota bacterium]MDR7562959.1 ABC transporter permease [Armatimonadota bacterium]MDR7567794.1 ABC transporter permease [Armatimonadota bacterium]MDR7603054.1 ABC transporter permease [Armatimonadota bacterium]
MGRYLVRRILTAIPTVLGIATVTFLALQAIPGDLAALLLELEGRPEEVLRLRQAYGLNRPLVVRYLEWMGGLLRADLGISSSSRQPVLSLLSARLPVTASLAFASMTVAFLVGCPLGLLAAQRAGSRMDLLVLLGSQVGLAVPSFLLGTLLLLAFAVMIPVFPLQGYVSFLHNPVEWARHLMLPALTLGLDRAAVLVRLVRASVLEELHRDYVRTARSKGLGEGTILRRHVLRNALIPILTVAGMQLGYLLGGAVVVEQVFGLPGLGRLAVQGIFARDTAVVQGAVVTLALVFVSLNLAVDLLYAALDPRITYGT